MTEEIWRQGYTQNRELSWLKFNQRVMAEARDPNVPLLERAKFLSIFTSNLDEFFMVRVGSLTDIAELDPTFIDSRSGMTAAQQLSAIYEAAAPLYRKRDKIHLELESLLAREGLCHVSMQELTAGEQKYLKQYFRQNVQPILSPQVVDSQHPFPHLYNKVIHVAVLLGKKKGEMLGLIPMPSSLPRVIYLREAPGRYVLLEDLIYLYADTIFGMYEILEKTLFCVTRNADISLDDEPFRPGETEDVRKKMEKVLRKRTRLRVVRVELSQPISERFAAHFRDRFSVTDSQIFISRNAPLDLSYLFSIGEFFTGSHYAALSDRPFTPQPPAMLQPGERLLQAAAKRDILLSYPYESMEPFLQMIREAAHAPDVVSIRITIYRLARKAKLAEYLCAAAENGKDVTVLIELRARFDEQNNIDWSERMEEAGCKVIYGVESFKVHAKVCLITRNERGVLRHITQIGTGNYNEKTAKQYTDVSLITASPEIGADAAEFFRNMALGNLDGSYQKLLVAPNGLKNQLLRQMDAQIALGKNGYILMKFNSLTDTDVIRKLSEASRAGVRVELIIRGICCLRPGVPDRTENITVQSIVGRYLEHSRIYCFGRGAGETMYIASADLMTRNTVRRVEVACPIESPAVRARLHQILDAILRDNVKARVLKADGKYSRKLQEYAPYCAQEVLMRQAETEAAAQPQETSSGGGFRHLLHWLKKSK